MLGVPLCCCVSCVCCLGCVCRVCVSPLLVCYVAAWCPACFVLCLALCSLCCVCVVFSLGWLLAGLLAFGRLVGWLAAACWRSGRLACLRLPDWEHLFCRGYKAIQERSAQAEITSLAEVKNLVPGSHRYQPVASIRQAGCRKEAVEDAGRKDAGCHGGVSSQDAGWDARCGLQTMPHSLVAPTRGARIYIIYISAGPP